MLTTGRMRQGTSALSSEVAFWRPWRSDNCPRVQGEKTMEPAAHFDDGLSMSGCSSAYVLKVMSVGDLQRSFQSHLDVPGIERPITPLH